jgi:thermopsin
VFLPANNPAGANRPLTNGHVSPLYNSTPAPLGVADFGLNDTGGLITPYLLTTSSVEGQFSDDYVHPLAVDAGAPDYYGVQLNAVLTNVSLLGATGYQFWTQNVIEYSTYAQQLYFIDNVWNFSSSAGYLSPNVFATHGPNGTQVGTSYYYGTGPILTVAEPFTVDLYLNSTVLSNGNQAVFFNYTVGAISGTYDYVEFNSGGSHAHPAVTPVYAANGFAYNPLGLTNDFEMVLCGPGGGSNVVILGADGDIALLYKTPLGQYASVPSAYDVGGETGETALGVTIGYYASPDHAWFYTGPSFLEGLWNTTTNVGAGFTEFYNHANPYNMFLFVALGTVAETAAGLSTFQWAPSYAPGDNEYYLPPADTTVSIALLQSEYTPAYFSGVGTPFTISGTLAANTNEGVYTPLWAFNGNDLANISTGGILYNNEYGNIGVLPFSSTYFPWFGLVNDYGFPTFPGIFLSGVSFPTVYNPPAFAVTIPPWQVNITTYFGLPTTNDLMLYFYDDYSVWLKNAAAIGGWFPTVAYFGNTASQANVVFWNTSGSEIVGNTFTTGSEALFLYGGSGNLIEGNTFQDGESFVAPSYYSIAGHAYGDTGLAEEDNDVAYGPDLIYNNDFLTDFTAVNPAFDPYASNFYYSFYGYFYADWNTTPTAGTNIIGGSNLSGNYWWNYGDSYNRYGPEPLQNPYANIVGGYYQMNWGGDYYPLVPFSLYTVTFKESGLPAHQSWAVEVLDPVNYGYAYNESPLTYINMTWPSYVGYHAYAYDSQDSYWVAVPYETTFTVHGANLVVDVYFQAAFVLTVKETGLPSGTEWYAETYNSAVGYHYEYSTGTDANVTGQSVRTYTWWASVYYNSPAYGKYYNVPFQATVTINANTTVVVTFVAAHSLDVHALGLPAGASWSFDANSTSGYNYSDGSTDGWINITTPAETYIWTAGSAGYVATPGSGTLTLSANTTLTVTFQAAASLTFSETGLTSGTPWTVTLTQGTAVTTLGGTGSSIAFATVVGSFTFTVNANGYVAQPSSGSGTLPVNSTESVTFVPATGTLSGTAIPSGATVWVDGVKQTLGSSGTFSLTLPVGVHSIEANASGYLNYFNNVSVTLGVTTTLTIALTAIPTAPSTTSSTSIPTLGWVIIAILAALAVLFLVTTLLFARRGRRPPAVATYNVPPGTATGAPPEGSVQPWQEPPPPPSGTS